MVKELVIVLVGGFIAVEVIEHMVFPVFWFFKNRKKRSVCGVTGMLGKVAEVKHWEKTEGRVFINGELWKAFSDIHLFRGDKVVIQGVDGLTLRVKPFEDGDVE
jgi:membrane-bound serine protease (ClpP class)